MLRLTKNFTLNLQAIWDVYTYALNSSGNPVRVNKLRLTEGKGLGKLSSTGTSFSYTFNNDTFKKLREKRRGKGKSSQSGDGSGGEGQQSQGDNGNQGGGNSQQGAVDADGYVPWAFPWSLSVNYSIAYAYGDFNKEKLEYNGKITQNLSFSGSIKPTPN